MLEVRFELIAQYNSRAMPQPALYQVMCNLLEIGLVGALDVKQIKD
jgi:hypothetical protein